MKRFPFLLLFTLHFTMNLKAQYHSVFEQNKTLTYPEVEQSYRNLVQQYPNCKIYEGGMTDAGRPLLLFTIGKTADLHREIADPGKVRILINNGIHPGEPDGIDACIYLAQKWLDKKSLPDNVLIGIIPAYNIDGMLNRTCCSRANQNGPEEYGFRGNSQNLDLNRDFIKCDSKNAQSFTEIFHFFDPHVLIDTHVSNGADYQYTMTLLMTQPDKLGPQGEYCRKVVTPRLYEEMKKKGFPMTPYVNTKGETPESGIVDFLETPRFATGYAALFGCIGITSETHMLKAYPQRVKSTIALIETVVSTATIYSRQLEEFRKEMRMTSMVKNEPHFHPLNFEPDTNRYSEFEFLGYEANHEPSVISGMMRLKYDRTKPFKKKIRYYDRFAPSLMIKVPQAYVIPQAWSRVIDRLQWNKINLKKIEKDTQFTVTSYTIRSFETVRNPYEGHYLHYKTQTDSKQEIMHFHKGDFIVSTKQAGWRYIVEALEPSSVDSYFNWNFFDAVLQQKEWFSDYVFEDLAAELLRKDADLNSRFEQRKKDDPSFAKDGFAQLLFIYRNSPYYEESHNRYPVYRIE